MAWQFLKKLNMKFLPNSTVSPYYIIKRMEHICSNKKFTVGQVNSSAGNGKWHGRVIPTSCLLTSAHPSKLKKNSKKRAQECSYQHYS